MCSRFGPSGAEGARSPRAGLREELSPEPPWQLAIVPLRRRSRASPERHASPPESGSGGERVVSAGSRRLPAPLGAPSPPGAQPKDSARSGKHTRDGRREEEAGARLAGRWRALRPQRRSGGRVARPDRRRGGGGGNPSGSPHRLSAGAERPGCPDRSRRRRAAGTPRAPATPSPRPRPGPPSGCGRAASRAAPRPTVRSRWRSP